MRKHLQNVQNRNRPPPTVCLPDRWSMETASMQNLQRRTLILRMPRSARHRRIMTGTERSPLTRSNVSRRTIVLQTICGCIRQTIRRCSSRRHRKQRRHLLRKQFCIMQKMERRNFRYLIRQEKRWMQRLPGIMQGLHGACSSFCLPFPIRKDFLILRKMPVWRKWMENPEFH